MLIHIANGAGAGYADNLPPGGYRGAICHEFIVRRFARQVRVHIDISGEPGLVIILAEVEEEIDAPVIEN